MNLKQCFNSQTGSQNKANFKKIISLVFQKLFAIYLKIPNYFKFMRF